jgi:chromosome partitioning protein
LFVSASGFSKPAITHVETEQPHNLRLGTVKETGYIIWNYPLSEARPSLTGTTEKTDKEIEEETKNSKINYIGVFTCKGGVGKTTVAAHLALRS